MLNESQIAVIKLFSEYSSIVSEAKLKPKYGKGLKILTPKQMLQRLPIALAQVKSGNTSEVKHQTDHIFFVLSKRNYLKLI